MALITDPDNLSQGTLTAIAGATWGSAAGAVVTITAAATLPAMAAGDYFEIRDHSVPGNNGLYLETGGAPTTSSVTATKQTGINPVNSASEAVSWYGRSTTAADKKSVHIDTNTRKIWLLKKGLLSTDGVTNQALYSFLKEEWKLDSFLIPHPFPMTAITPEQFELTLDWTYIDNTTRKLIRTGGWREISTAGVLQQEWVGVVTLGTFEDSTPVTGDLAYYQQGNDPADTAAGVSFDFTGPVNEAVRSYNFVTVPATYTSIAITGANTLTRSVGSWITEGYKKGGQITIVSAEDPSNVGTFVISSVTATVLVVAGTLVNNAADTALTAAVNNRNVLNLFLRVRDADPNGKTYAQSNLAAIGVASVDNKVFRFPLSNATDLKIATSDATIASTSPWNQIGIKYFDQPFNKQVDSAVTNRNYGVVIDVGTHSGVDGSFTSGGTVLTTAEGGIVGATYAGGTITIHEGANKGSVFNISGTPSATQVAISGGTFAATESNISFTLQRATPVVATAEQIYEKVQYLLRQAADIDQTDQVVTGKTTGALLRFVGDTLEAGQALSPNPNGGGAGVIIQGYSSNDTNRLTFYDSLGTARTFPFVAAGSINFNANLVNDGAAKYWMFYQYVTRKAVADLAISAASGSTATFTSAGANLLSTVQNQYFNLLGASDANNNGIWIVTSVSPTTTTFTARKVDGLTVSNQASFAATMDDNPINSPDAIIVKNNAGVDITGTIGSASVSFDFDYDGNTQGGRTPGTNAAIVLRAIGLTTGQFVESTGTITRATGQSFSLVAALERNYANP